MRHKTVVLKHEERYKNDIIYEKKLDDNATFHTNVVEEEVFSMLISEVNDLPPHLRSVYLLVLEGRRNQEIADELGYIVDTVKTYKKTGKNILVKRLKGSESLKLIFSLLQI